MPQRRDYIDELKGLGILLVVLGHFIEQYRMGYSFVSSSFFCIYAFHMALFCICSGLVARFNPRKLVTQQLWLYLVGQTLMLAFRAAVLRENFAETGGLLAAWLLPWRHIWYLYALIFWHLTLPVLCRLRDRLGLAGSCLGMALAVGLALAAGLVDWPFTLVRVFAFYPFYACGVLLRPQLDRLAAFAAEHRPVRLVAAAGLVLGYGAYFLWVLRADPIMDHSAELFHDVSYAGGDRVQYRVVFYLVGIVTTAALTVLASRRHLLAGLGRHTLAIYLLHLPVQALLVELGLYDLMRGKATIFVVLWSVLLAAVTLAVTTAAELAPRPTPTVPMAAQTCHNDILLLLVHSQVKVEKHQVRKVLQECWKLTPASNGLTYTTYQFNYNRECRYEPIKRVGRFYTVTREQLESL